MPRWEDEILRASGSSSHYDQNAERVLMISLLAGLTKWISLSANFGLHLMVGPLMPTVNTCKCGEDVCGGHFCLNRCFSFASCCNHTNSTNNQCGCFLFYGLRSTWLSESLATEAVLTIITTNRHSQYGLSFRLTSTFSSFIYKYLILSNTILSSFCCRQICKFVTHVSKILLAWSMVVEIQLKYSTSLGDGYFWYPFYNVFGSVFVSTSKFMFDVKSR